MGELLITINHLELDGRTGAAADMLGRFGSQMGQSDSHSEESPVMRAQSRKISQLGMPAEATANQSR